MLVLTQEAIKQLDLIIQDMPVKYGLPLLNFLNAQLREQQARQDAIDKLEKNELKEEEPLPVPKID